ncbi:unnamed protein product [Rangifer tarandus platyrhynchus]|uniref:Uncharacterized protein n=1 Tax=Rangifer tarandus platyrhynchus TaxID=3082113 RepID=A0ABN8XK30_RANTA|nr:unnamed protein product [Rangifer tarandus platyrhynchus]
MADAATADARHSRRVYPSALPGWSAVRGFFRSVAAAVAVGPGAGVTTASSVRMQLLLVTVYLRLHGRTDVYVRAKIFGNIEQHRRCATDEDLSTHAVEGSYEITNPFVTCVSTSAPSLQWTRSQPPQAVCPGSLLCQLLVGFAAWEEAIKEPQQTYPLSCCPLLHEELKYGERSTG